MNEIYFYSTNEDKTGDRNYTKYFFIHVTLERFFKGNFY